MTAATVTILDRSPEPSGKDWDVKIIYNVWAQFANDPEHWSMVYETNYLADAIHALKDFVADSPDPNDKYRLVRETMVTTWISEEVVLP